jgi:hypothetical protein
MTRTRVPGEMAMANRQMRPPSYEPALENVFVAGRYVGAIVATIQGYAVHGPNGERVGMYATKGRARKVLEGEEPPCIDC